MPQQPAPGTQCRPVAMKSFLAPLDFRSVSQVAVEMSGHWDCSMVTALRYISGRSVQIQISPATQRNWESYLIASLSHQKLHAFIKNPSKCLHHVQVNDSGDMQKLFPGSDSEKCHFYWLKRKNPYNNFVIMFSLGAVRELKKPIALIKCPVISISSSKPFYHKTNIMLSPFIWGFSVALNTLR